MRKASTVLHLLIEDEDYDISMGGEYQIYNAMTAIDVLEVLLG